MLKKIIAGGHTGAERAALDTAIKFNLDHGGWPPAGKGEEDGALSDKYHLTEMERERYPTGREQNIINADGTLIISRGELSEGSLLTRKIASYRNKPWCHIDLMEMDEFEGAVTLHDFVVDNSLEILNVTGPRESQDPFIYRSVKSIIETFIYMELMERSPDDLRSDDIILFQRRAELLCTTIEDAVIFLAESMQLRTRSVIANSHESQIGSLYFSLSDTIKVKLGLDEQNPALLEACRNRIKNGENFGADVMDIEDATMVILKELRLFLKKNHVLRLIK